MPITVVLDKARDQRGALGQAVAPGWGIELLYLPTYAPNVNLRERFWKVVKKPCLYSKYYPESESFQQAILTGIQQAPTPHKEALNQLLTLRFQTFQDVSVIGEQHTVSTGAKKKVLSKAA